MLSAPSAESYARRYTTLNDIVPGYAGQLVHRARLLDDFLTGRGLTASDAELSAFLASLQGLSPSTVAGYRRCLLVLLSAAADDGLRDYPVSRRVRRVKVPHPLPQIWTLAEVRQLLDHVRGSYWELVVRVGYESGLRRADCLRLRRSEVRTEPTMIRIGKTQRSHWIRFARETAEMVENDPALSSPWQPTHWARLFIRQVQAAGLRGSFRWLRRSAGSHVEAAGGDGARFLGHSGRATFEQFYRGEGRCQMPLLGAGQTADDIR